LGISVYFARPYHSWERGLNENSNGLLRQYFPKSQELGSVDQAELVDALCRMNHRPREILGFRTPYEVFFDVSVNYVESVDVAFQS
jgi:IS30 family transposase